MKYTPSNDVTPFSSLSFEEQKTVLKAMILGCADEWGQECMPAAGSGDNRVFDLDELIDWVDAR